MADSCTTPDAHHPVRFRRRLPSERSEKRRQVIFAGCVAAWATCANGSTVGHGGILEPAFTPRLAETQRQELGAWRSMLSKAVSRWTLSVPSMRIAFVSQA